MPIADARTLPKRSRARSSALWLKVSAYDNRVHVDSADTVDVSGYRNAVTYHSGSPKVTQSGYDIVVKQG
jgi:hypothetical protein